MQFLVLMAWSVVGATFSMVTLVASAPDRPDGPASVVDARRPNVVFIMADDLGWRDVGFNGGDIKTPRLDRLAEEGVRFTQFYTQPLCSPTRAALLTGRYPIRYGLHVGVVRPHATYGLPEEERTLAQALREAGYRTAITGKWHLGTARRELLPMQRGFDSHYGLYTGNFDYFSHRRDGGLDWHRNGEPLEEEGYSTHLIAAESARLILEHNGERPLFLYVAFNAPHYPLQVPERYVKPYANWLEPRRTYAGMVAAMDEGIGLIIDALDQSGQRENTLIVFCSDNGGARPRSVLGESAEGQVSDNGPFRSEKGTLYEGGIRVPALVNWLGKVPAGTSVSAPIHIVDWYPTLLRLAGGNLQQPNPIDGVDVWRTVALGEPANRDELLLNIGIVGGGVRVGDWKLLINPQVRDGVEGGIETEQRREEKRRALASPVIELFNLRDDPGEKMNLAEQFPERVCELRKRLEFFRSEAVPSKQAPPSSDFKVPAIWGVQ